jgi:hypothetical protein
VSILPVPALKRQSMCMHQCSKSLSKTPEEAPARIYALASMITVCFSLYQYIYSDLPELKIVSDCFKKGRFVVFTSKNVL